MESAAARSAQKMARPTTIPRGLIKVCMAILSIKCH
jgi:hypothetical protein